MKNTESLNPKGKEQERGKKKNQKTGCTKKTTTSKGAILSPYL